MIRNAEGKTSSVREEHKYTPTEKRYLVSIGSNSISILDRIEQRIIYSQTVSDKVKAFKGVTRIYGSRNIEVIEGTQTTLIVNPLPITNRLRITKKEVDGNNTKVTVETIPEQTLKIRETFKWIDKYKHKLQPKFKYNEKDNILEINLINETTELGIHIIQCNLNENLYSYYYKGKLVGKKNNLEDIFKPKIK